MNIVRKIATVSLDEFKGNVKKFKPKKEKPKPQKYKKLGMKRKGRLPSKQIINKLGNTQTVYYRPDKNSKSKYVDGASMSPEDVMMGYKESFKRMLFMDHDKGSNWVREKGGKDHAQGSAMVSKLDKLADKYGFTMDNFDSNQNKTVKEYHHNTDGFLMEAQNIYGELYKTKDKHPFAMLKRVFAPTNAKIHSTQAGIIADNILKNEKAFIDKHKSPATKLKTDKPKTVKPKPAMPKSAGKVTKKMTVIGDKAPSTAAADDDDKKASDTAANTPKTKSSTKSKIAKFVGKDALSNLMKDLFK